jgi:hypothetical protein
MGAPAINQWLASLLPAQPVGVICKVVITDPVSGNETPTEVTWDELKLQPIDLLYLVHTENEQAMAELDDRILRRINERVTPRLDAKIEIKYTDRDNTRFTFFELAPLVRSLRELALSSRPLQATDVMLSTEAKQAQDTNVFFDKTHVEALHDILEPLQQDLADFAALLGTQLDTLRPLQTEWEALKRNCRQRPREL